VAALGKARRGKKQGRTVLHRSRAQGREARAQAGACWPGCRRHEGRRSGCAQVGEKRHGRDGSILWCTSLSTRPGAHRGGAATPRRRARLRNRGTQGWAYSGQEEEEDARGARAGSSNRAPGWREATGKNEAAQFIGTWRCGIWQAGTRRRIGLELVPEFGLAMGEMRQG
jgi:hypothetical protein